MTKTKMSNVALDDKYKKREGRVLLTGVQALARLVLARSDLDRAAGINTGGYVSGYRGSPLGGVDMTFEKIAPMLKERNIVFRPGVNEDLAVTAVWGSQQVGLEPGATVDGVFGLWYGKGPGVDRSGDALRHANMAGSSKNGGVVLAVGDDHIAKSSTLGFHSEAVCAGLEIPMFYPSDVQEIVRFGLHGYALSRFSGCYVALKILPDVADSTQAIDGDEMDFKPVLPEVAMPPEGLNIKYPETALEKEARHYNYRLPAVLAYARANKLDRSVWRRPDSKIGFVAAGKSWLDLLEALWLLGIDEKRAGELGIALYKPTMIWPLEPEGISEFARGLSTVIVVEEKFGFVEQQIRSILYSLPKDSQPQIFGKKTPEGAAYLPLNGELKPDMIAAAAGQTLADQLQDALLSESVARVKSLNAGSNSLAVAPVIRRPHFCSGCPHNTSTQLPAGSRALAGIGCHGMATWIMPQTSAYTHMGAEGVPWLAQAPFTTEPHVFVNLGDGTYFHSGIMAIRQACAANVNMTYKILYNGAVAMTGGQPVDGELSVPILIAQVKAEGVKDIVIVTDDVEKYEDVPEVRQHARIEYRDELDKVQRELREKPGVTVLIYDQMCATERRRKRKRGQMADPAKRIFINELVCEGCGDCSAKSYCLSVEPVETEFGRKRRINQSSCNKDYSCTKGFCPSFVTVEGGTLRKVQKRSLSAMTDLAVLPQPPAASDDHFRMIVAGIGGTGVVTIGAVLSMAAHMEGRATSVLDVTGTAQKGGAVVGYIHIARTDADIAALKVAPGGASVLLASDQVVASSKEVIAAIDSDKTEVVINQNVSITSDFTQNPEATVRQDLLARRISERAGAGRVASQPFIYYAERLFGDAIASNMMMVGYAFQRGAIPLSADAIERAITMNGASVQMNIDAFRCGRLMAVDMAKIEAVTNTSEVQPETLDEMIARRAEFLTSYQNKAYADHFREVIGRVRAREAALGQGTALTDASARSLFKLMAYKDEYEVARLYTDGTFKKKLGEQFEGDFKLKFHLAPPLLAPRDPETGHLKKQTYGAWMWAGYQVLAKLKGLRGTAFDIFGHTTERKTERKLIGAFETVLSEIGQSLRLENAALALQIAALPMRIRGYGHIKDAAVAEYEAELVKLLAQLRGGSTNAARMAAE